MDQKSAQIVFVIFNLLAIPVVIFAFYEYFQVNAAMVRKDEVIPFDTGTYYLLLASIFWVMWVIQYIGKRDESGARFVDKYANFILIGWVIGILVLANLVPYYLQEKIHKLGYIACDDPREISRIAKGASILYSKAGCANL